MHVYERLSEQQLPRLGSGSSDAEIARLEEAVREMIAQPLPRKLDPPSPDFRPTPLAPTKEAEVAHKAHLKELLKAYHDFMELTKHGIFRLPPVGGAQLAEDAQGTLSSSSSHATASRLRKKAPRKVTCEERKLVGQVFQDDGIDWKVLDVEWSDEVDPPQVMVFYYDVDAAMAEGTLESDLLEALDEDGDEGNMEHIEWSKVSEVQAWLRASKSM